MIKKMKTNEGIQYKKLSPEEMKSRGILGRLIGPCADFNNATRNGRKYSEQLWENVFNDPIMQERIKNGVCFGELGHPEDRTDIDIEKVAVCMREQPFKNEKGQLCAVFDILDTPNGRILKTLCDYGSTVGVSSRGQGDIITDIQGNETVDPDTYECTCWDVVLIPAVKSARMQYVKEDLNSPKGLKLKKALTESLNHATEEERKVMENTLKDLNINLNEEKQPEEVANMKSEISDEDYIKNGEKMVEKIKNDLTPEECCVLYFDEYKFQEHSPDDEVEEKIYDALRAKIKNIFSDKPTESLNESDEELPVDELEQEIPVVELETEDEVPPEELPLEGDIQPVDEVPNEVIDTTELEIVPTEEPSEGDVEEPVDERTDEEIFFDYLKTNFDEKQIKKVCKVLEIELPEESEEEKVEDEKPADEEPKAEEEDKVEEPEEKEEGSEEKKEECNDESCADKEEEAKEVVEESTPAVNDGDAELVKSLQEALKNVSDLEESVKNLQEKLAVSDTKVNELTEENNNHKKAIARLATMSKSSKDLKESVSTLEESLKEKDTIIEDQKSRIARLVKSRKETVSESLSLNESVTAKTNEVNSLTESLNSTKEEVTKLTEELSKVKADSETKVTELTEDLNKTKALKEAYAKLANKSVNKYIEIKANMLGLTSKDIKRKLGESYTLEDVDQVCEDLKAYQLNVSKLPFSIDRKVGIKVNESRQIKSSKFDDDEVDDSLIKLAKINL